MTFGTFLAVVGAAIFFWVLPLWASIPIAVGVWFLAGKLADWWVKA
jgi:hypothetical protein